MTPRVQVHLWSALRRHTGGAEVVEVEAATTGQLLEALRRDYPGLGPMIDAGVSVAIDGRIYATSLSQPVTPENEIFILQRIKGG